MKLTSINKNLERIAIALEKLQVNSNKNCDLLSFEGYNWNTVIKNLSSVKSIDRFPLESLKGISSQKDILYKNTKAFSLGHNANNTLLWGARGTGKSSLIKSIHGDLIKNGINIGLVEISKEDLHDLPYLIKILSEVDRRFIVFCDDLSFDKNDKAYKTLKVVLEGGLFGKPKNIVFYATSNRRHIIERDNISSNTFNEKESNEEKISLSDRFGLWIGFHSIDQETYLDIILWYVKYYKIPISEKIAKEESLKWSVLRGNRSGRTAFQYIIDLAIKKNIKI